MQNYLNLREVAQELGTSIHTVRHWVKTGRLPSIRPAKYRLVEREKLREFMRRNARGYDEAPLP